MSLTAGLGSFDPNTLPMDAFTLSGGPADTERLIGLKAPWKFDGESVSYPISGFVSGRGWWTKFADGTLIQRFTQPVSRTTIDNNNIGSYGWSLYTSDIYNWTFPIPFVASSPGDDIVIAASSRFSGYASVGAPSASGVGISAHGPTSADTIIRMIAIGRWKA